MSTNSKGYCYLCEATLGNPAMKNHFSKFHECKNGQDCYLLKIEGGYAKDYWLYIDIPVEKTLREIDTFLRKIWLECCGHLSSFHEPEDLIHTFIPKNSKLKSITVGECMTHLYDYGTTSHTYITFIETITREPQRKNVRLLARNAPIIFQCEDCGSQAEYKYEYFFLMAHLDFYVQNAEWSIQKMNVLDCRLLIRREQVCVDIQVSLILLLLILIYFRIKRKKESYANSFATN